MLYDFTYKKCTHRWEGPSGVLVTRASRVCKFIHSWALIHILTYALGTFLCGLYLKANKQKLGGGGKWGMPWVTIPHQEPSSLFDIVTSDLGDL